MGQKHPPAAKGLLGTPRRLSATQRNKIQQQQLGAAQHRQTMQFRHISVFLLLKATSHPKSFTP
jgi:hypothetical protein